MKITGDDAKGFAILLTVGVAGVVVLTWFAKKQIKDVVGGAAGLVSGNNEITRGTAYEGWGVAGTLGAIANSASGGALASAGSWLGGAMFDLLHKSTDPNNPKSPTSVRTATMKSPVRPEDKMTMYARL